jgi:hypothetical protein
MTLTQDQVRGLALALPEVTEADHHGRPSFRLGTSVLATVSGDALLNVMVGESEAHAAAAESGACTLLWWGKRLSGVQVDLGAADTALVADLLEEAWRRRAPRRLLRESPDGPDVAG